MAATEKQLTPFFTDTNRKADTILHYTILGYCALGLLLALFYNTRLIALGVESCCFLAYFVAKAFLPMCSLYRCFANATLAAFTA